MYYYKRICLESFKLITDLVFEKAADKRFEMSDFNFEGDLQGARKPQLDFISKVLEKYGFKSCKVIIEPVGKAGDNFMANVKRIVVKENGETLRMVAKLAPENPVQRDVVNIGIVFQNEHYLYTEIFPKFDQKQKAAGITENEYFRFAKCYGSFNEEPNEVILLEDLKESNFDITNRFDPLTNENVKMVLRNYAIYHALSFAIKYQEPETYAVFQKLLAPNMDVYGWNEQSMQFFKQIEAQALEVSDMRYHKVIKGLFENASKAERKVRKLAKDSKYTVIQHGDGTTNNIMFRFENGVPMECMVIDYQMARESSPVFDLMFMLFNSTTHKQRSQHFYEFIDYYHNELDKALNNFGLKANYVYPRDRLDADLKIYGKLIFATSILISSMVTKNTEDSMKMKEAIEITDMNNIDKALEMMMMNDEVSLNMFKIRVEGLADSFSEFGLL